MKLDDLMCICTIIFFFYCILDAIYYSYFYVKPIKIESLHNKYITILEKKINNNFDIYIPKIKKEYKYLEKSDTIYKEVKIILNKIFSDISNIKIKDLSIQAKIFNNIKYLNIDCILITLENISKINIDLLFISSSEYYIINLNKKLKTNNLIPKKKY